MIAEWFRIWQSMTVLQMAVELLDILVVAFLLYRGLLVLKGTR
ncbi:MAG: TIGR00159 family protein, partial [Deltaproteobacteria bacterium HGW-Deltaproteobacteria-20]